MDDTQKTKPKAQDRAEWPNTIRTREELDAALEAGLKSGVSKRSFDEIVAAGIKRAEHG